MASERDRKPSGRPPPKQLQTQRGYAAISPRSNEPSDDASRDPRGTAPTLDTVVPAHVPAPLPPPKPPSKPPSAMPTSRFEPASYSRRGRTNPPPPLPDGVPIPQWVDNPISATLPPVAPPIRRSPGLPGSPPSQPPPRAPSPIPERYPSQVTNLRNIARSDPAEYGSHASYDLATDDPTMADPTDEEARAAADYDAPPLPEGVPVPQWLPNPIHERFPHPGAPQSQSQSGNLPPPVNIQVQTPAPYGSPFEELAPVPGNVFERLLPRNSVLRGPRPTWFLPMVAVFGSIVLLGSCGLLLRMASSGGDNPKAKAHSAKEGKGTAAAAVAPSSPVAPSAAPAAAPATPPAAAPADVANPAPAPKPRPSFTSHTACTVTGAAQSIGARALVSSGIEASMFGSSRLAFGFASSEHEASVVEVDPIDLRLVESAQLRSKDTIRRVLPITGAKLTATIDADAAKDPLRGRRLVAPNIDMGEANGYLAATVHGSKATEPLWAVDGSIEAIRAVEIPGDGDRSFVVAFRHNAKIAIGVVRSSGKHFAAQGDLTHIDGLGDRVGSPAIAVSGLSAFVIWADRRGDSDPWRLRYTQFPITGRPTEAKTFVVPLGGPGDRAMSPGVTAVFGERFLVVWTEGPVTNQRVRAQTMSVNGLMIGNPLSVSAEGLNAGQGQPIVTAEGFGAVAYLVGKESFEVMATAIRCLP